MFDARLSGKIRTEAPDGIIPLVTDIIDETETPLFQFKVYKYMIY